MNDTHPDNVPYIVYESSMARAERHTRRLIVALVISILLIAVSNMAWLWAWMQYDYVSEETVIDVDSGDSGNANYIGHNGDIVNGTSDSNKAQTLKNE